MKRNMKAIYLVPKTEVLHVETAYNVLKSISGPAGLKDGGKVPGELIEPQ